MFTENTIGLSDQHYSCLQIQKHFKIAYLILANKKKVVHGSSSNPIKDAVRVFLSREARMEIQRSARWKAKMNLRDEGCHKALLLLQHRGLKNSVLIWFSSHMRRVRAGALLRAIKETCLLSHSPGILFISPICGLFSCILPQPFAAHPTSSDLLHLVCINPNCSKHPADKQAETQIEGLC